MLEKFIEENIERDIKSFEYTDAMYVRYLKFCGFHKVKALTRLQFGKRIGKYNVGIYDNRKIKSARWGVKLLPCKY